MFTKLVGASSKNINFSIPRSVQCSLIQVGQKRPKKSIDHIIILSICLRTTDETTCLISHYTKTFHHDFLPGSPTKRPGGGGQSIIRANRGNAMHCNTVTASMVTVTQSYNDSTYHSMHSCGVPSSHADRPKVCRCSINIMCNYHESCCQTPLACLYVYYY